MKTNQITIALFYSLIFALFTQVNAKTKSEKVGIEIVKLKGDSFYSRDGARPIKLTKQTQLKDGDILETSPKSFLRFKINQAVLTLAPNTYFKISTQMEQKEGKADLGKLIYGHLHGDFKKSKIKIRSIKTPFSSLGVRGTTILLHVSRDEKEYGKRYRGDIAPLPSLEDWNKLIRTGAGFTQICCIKGKVEAETNFGEKSSLKTGEVFAFKSNGKETKSKSYRKGVLENSSKIFGFEF